MRTWDFSVSLPFVGVVSFIVLIVCLAAADGCSKRCTKEAYAQCIAAGRRDCATEAREVCR